jgi:ATP phosphoribosyltransferase
MQMVSMTRIRFAIPKGSLEKDTFDILQRAGYMISGERRTYRPAVNDSDIELKILRPQEIPLLVADGTNEIGITGQDWVYETGVDVVTLLPLAYGGIKMVTAVPETWADVDSLTGLLRKFWDDGKNVRFSTEYLNTASHYIMANGEYRERFGDAEPLVVTPWLRRGTNPKVTITLSFGATEAKPPENAEAIIDVSETGTTLQQNNLKVIDIIKESEAVLIANREALRERDREEKIYDVLTLLRGVVEGKEKIHIFVNVEEKNLEELVKNLPSLKGPTISHLSRDGWYSVNTVIDRRDFLRILPTLRRLAQGLVVHEPRQILSLEGTNGRKLAQ